MSATKRIQIEKNLLELRITICFNFDQNLEVSVEKFFHR